LGAGVLEWRGVCARERGWWTKMKKAAYRKRKVGWRGWREACLEN
jgi:hypothetical protein